MLSSALDCGTVISIMFIFFALQVIIFSFSFSFWWMDFEWSLSSVPERWVPSALVG